MTAEAQYRINLQMLEAQAAQYGMTPPITLMNEIAFHQLKLQEIQHQRVSKTLSADMSAWQCDMLHILVIFDLFALAMIDGADMLLQAIVFWL